MEPLIKTKKTTKIGLLGLAIVLILSVSMVPATELLANAYPNTNRTGNMGMLISAWQMDDHGITPSQCKSMIDNIYSAKGVSFSAIKITYGYDPSVHTSTQMVNHIHDWVDYFDAYYSNIYVASRTVFHHEQKLTTSERDTYYEALASSLSSHSAVKGFFGEEEPEASQVDPYNGDPEGNNLAYSSISDMMSYVEGLHDEWRAHSSIPFSFESIPPASYDTHSGVTYIHGDPSCWFDTNGCVASTYWQWIDDNQDFFAIDEWRTHWGTQEWADHVREYNEANNPDKKMVIGETFNLDWVETERLWDQFNYASVNDLGYAFWWMLCGSEYVPSENAGAPEPYIYFDGGYKGHCWAFTHMQTKTSATNNLCGSGIASAMTYSDGSTDYAYASMPTTSHSETLFNFECFVRYNVDVSAVRGYGTTDIVFGKWTGHAFDGTYYDTYYSAKGRYESTGDIDLVIEYPDQYASQQTIVLENKTVPNCWNWVGIRNYNGDLYISYGWEDSSGTLHTTSATYYDNTWADYWIPETSMSFGAYGGARTKLYIGALGIFDWQSSTNTLIDDFENYYNRDSTWHMYSASYPWSATFSEPSAVQGSSRIVPSNGAWWMLARLRYTVDY